MPDRSLFYAATPEAAYLIVRDQALPNPAEPVPGEADMVELVARRGGCPGGTAVAVTVNEQDLRPGDPGRPGSFLVLERRSPRPRSGGPSNPGTPTSNPTRTNGGRPTCGPEPLTLRNLLGANTPGALRTREDNRVTAQLIALTKHPVAARFGSSKADEVTGRR